MRAMFSRQKSQRRGGMKFLEDGEFTKTVLFGLSAVGALLLVGLAVYANLVLK